MAKTLSPDSRWQYLYTNIVSIVAVNLVGCVYEADQSRSLAMAEVEKSAEAAAPLHVVDRAFRRCRVLQKPVVESLMLSLTGALKTMVYIAEGVVARPAPRQPKVLETCSATASFSRWSMSQSA